MTSPNLFVVGAMKAGTTAMYNWLDSHPSIRMSPVKEPNFFCSDLWDAASHVAPGTPERIERALIQGLHTAIIRDESVYRSLFPAGDGTYVYTGESSPTYLRSGVAAQRIAEWSPDAKIIVLLRDPIERAWSHYLMERNEARVPEQFADLMDLELRMLSEGRVPQHGILQSGLYYAGIERYLARFAREQIFIADHTELRDRNRLIARLNAFLGFDDDRFPATVDARNPAVAPKYPRLNRFLAASGVKPLVRRVLPQRIIERAKNNYYGKPSSANELTGADRARLIEFYRDDVTRLAKFLGPAAPDWTATYLAPR